jgi:hypothetical protein
MAIAALLLASACGPGVTPAAVATPIAIATAVRTPPPAMTPTGEPTHTMTFAPTATPLPTDTLWPTATRARRTATPLPTPPPVETPGPTSLPTEAGTPTPEATEWMTVSPTSGPAGTKFTFTGGNWYTNMPITVLVVGPNRAIVFVTPIVPNTAGEVKFTWTSKDTLASGRYTFKFRQRVGLEAPTPMTPSIVTATPAPTSTTPGPSREEKTVDVDLTITSK